MPNISQFLNGPGEPWFIQVGFTFALMLVVFLALRIFVWSAGRRLDRLAPTTSTLLDDLLAILVRSTRKYFLLALSIYAGSLFAPVSDRTHGIFEKAIIFILLFQVLIWSRISIDFWIERYLRKKGAGEPGTATTIGLISFSVRAAVFTLIALLALNNLGVNITAVIAGLGVGGVAVALALQNILGDLFASLTIVLDKPFIAGDFIVVGEFMGTIEHIGLKTTRLRSLSGEQLVFANGDLLQSRIRNFKRMAERRVVLNLSVTYQTEEEKLREIPAIAKRAVENQNSGKSRVRYDRCHFLDFQDSALRFELVYWVLSADFNQYADIAQEINLQIFKEFGNLGIDFAYPTRTVHTLKPSLE